MKRLVVPSILAIAASSFALASVASAQPKDPKFEYGKADDVKEVKDVEWDAVAEAGIVFTTGNSKTTTVAAGFKASRKTGKNKLAFEGSLTYAKSTVRTLAMGIDPAMPITRDDIISTSTTTAETLATKARYDRFLTEHNSLFIAALASRDLPAGKESVLGGQVGYSRQLFKNEVWIARFLPIFADTAARTLMRVSSPNFASRVTRSSLLRLVRISAAESSVVPVDRLAL